MQIASESQSSAESGKKRALDGEAAGESQLIRTHESLPCCSTLVAAALWGSKAARERKLAKVGKDGKDARAKLPELPPILEKVAADGTILIPLWKSEQTAKPRWLPKMPSVGAELSEAELREKSKELEGWRVEAEYRMMVYRGDEKASEPGVRSLNAEDLAAAEELYLRQIDKLNTLSDKVNTRLEKIAKEKERLRAATASSSSTDSVAAKQDSKEQQSEDTDTMALSLSLAPGPRVSSTSSSTATASSSQSRVKLHLKDAVENSLTQLLLKEAMENSPMENSPSKNLSKRKKPVSETTEDHFKRITAEIEAKSKENGGFPHAADAVWKATDAMLSEMRASKRRKTEEDEKARQEQEDAEERAEDQMEAAEIEEAEVEEAAEESEAASDSEAAGELGDSDVASMEIEAS